MRQHMEELDNARKVYEEKNHEKNQLREEWEMRLEEKRKYNEIQEIVKAKEEEQRKKMDLLAKAAEWI